MCHKRHSLWFFVSQKKLKINLLQVTYFGDFCGIFPKKIYEKHMWIYVSTCICSECFICFELEMIQNAPVTQFKWSKKVKCKKYLSLHVLRVFVNAMLQKSVGVEVVAHSSLCSDYTSHHFWWAIQLQCYSIWDYQWRMQAFEIGVSLIIWGIQTFRFD